MPENTITTSRFWRDRDKEALRIISTKADRRSSADYNCHHSNQSPQWDLRY